MTAPHHRRGPRAARGRRRARTRHSVAPGQWEVRARVERFVEPALLLLLAERPMHGYELLDLVPGIAREERRVDLGNLYRLLRSLEEEGIVDSEWNESLPGPAKRVYRLTDSGRELLARWAEALGEAREVITAFIDRYRGEEVTT
ncbi:MAG TPA: PadR family transcriptional regulator [Miltoncostaeaceae bacterium]|nr:PadR family transcriptional regulator [Miltoncostaeaceae bacterium]